VARRPVYPWSSEAIKTDYRLRGEEVDIAGLVIIILLGLVALVGGYIEIVTRIDEWWENREREKGEK